MLIFKNCEQTQKFTERKKLTVMTVDELYEFIKDKSQYNFENKKNENLPIFDRIFIQQCFEGLDLDLVTFWDCVFVDCNGIDVINKVKMYV